MLAMNSKSDTGSMPSRRKPYINIGTIGQNDHGKTTLTAAITRTLAAKFSSTIMTYEEIDNAPEKKFHGTTIRSAQIEYKTETRFYRQVDCPRHADYIKNMLSGVGQMDGAILVVSATDGPMPQTRGQIRLARQAGVPYIIVFLNKCDLVDDDQQLELVEMKVRELLCEYDFPGNNVPIIKGSAQEALNGVGGELGERAIIRLGEALDAYIPAPVQAVSRPFLMPVEQAFSVGARGMTVTGRVERGVISVGDEVEVVGFGRIARTVCIGIETFKEQQDFVEAGEVDNVGILLRGLKREEVRSGYVLAMPGTARMHTHFTAEVYMLDMDEGGRARPFPNHYQPQLSFHRMDVKGAVSFPRGREMAMPGNNLSITVKLIAWIAIEEGLHFTIHEGGKTLGFGVVTSILE
ncbi:unnamed protein product [Penicillium olsonii]|nr:unnamed protein product [Penicillium olsonii]